MTFDLAKKVALAIVSRWNKQTIWLVRWPISEGHTECRWFRSEEKARHHASMILGSIITKEHFPVGDGPTCNDDV